jgi:hypothetical protein
MKRKDSKIFLLSICTPTFGEGSRKELFNLICPFILEEKLVLSTMDFSITYRHHTTHCKLFQFVQVSLGTEQCSTTMGLDYEHMIKARAHKGGVRIGKTPKKLVSICCP